jgi:hypothetical protein
MDPEQTKEMILKTQNHCWSVELKALGKGGYEGWDFVSEEDLWFDIDPYTRMIGIQR